MKSLLQLLFSVLIAASALSTAQAQQGFSHELGLLTGPVAFQSDYGLRNDWDTNRGNVGVGIGLVHYINFSYTADCNCYTRYTYWNDHFKVRTELDYHVVNLDHFGEESEKPTIGGAQLRAMHGQTNVFEAGFSLEWYPLSIRDYAEGYPDFAPYLGLGAHFVHYRPEAESDLGPLNNPFTTFRTFDGFIDTDPGNTYAIVGYVGTRYKLGPVSDLLIEAKWHYYGTDFVDGLDHPFPQNKANDWIFWIGVGYVHYLDFSD